MPLKLPDKPTDEKRTAVDERSGSGPAANGGSSVGLADAQAAKELAELFGQTVPPSETGPDSGSRTALAEQGQAPTQPPDGGDSAGPGVQFSGTLLDQLLPLGVTATVSGLPGDGLFDFKQSVQEELLRRVNKHKTSFVGLNDAEFRVKVREVVVSILSDPATVIPSGWTTSSMLTELLNDFLGLGPLEKFLADDTITEVMVNRPDQIYVERHGRLEQTNVRFLNENQVRAVIQRIIQPLGRRVDESVPYVDARLPDGSRVHAIIPPLALNGAKITIRKFARHKLTTDDLLRLGSLNRQIARFLEMMVKFRANIMISGGTGTGKTTLLNVLSNFIPDSQRIITIEDAAELKINKTHVLSLEARAANAEGTGAVSIRELVRNTLRMRPDRIVVGECRGGEALDMLQAMNTGHDGSLTTIHANSPRDALSRLETLVLMAGVELPSRAIRDQISSAINLVVQCSRMPDGSRKITDITEISGIGENNIFLTQEIFLFKQQGLDTTGKIVGRYQATGTIPRIVERMRARGIKISMEVFAAS